MDYTKINAKTFDRWVEEGWAYGVPVSAELCKRARGGDWRVFLTPAKPVPKEWFPGLKGKKLLGLASGGGQQMPIFAVCGADCTVLDISKKQLESEKAVSAREGYKIEIVEADMTKRLSFEDNAFDIIFHPVSNVYIEDVYHVWRECFRILKPGGVLMSGLDNGINHLFDEYKEPLTVANKLPFNPLKNPEQNKKLMEEDGALQFSHGFDEQIGGQLSAGFILTAAYQDFDADEDGAADILKEYGIPPYWAARAVKP